MTEKRFINKRRRQRHKSFLTTRNLLMLILLSVTAYGAFALYVGDPGASTCVGGSCQSEYSIAAWVIAFAVLLGAMAVGGIVVGSIIAFARRGNRPSLSVIGDQMSAAQGDNRGDDRGDDQGTARKDKTDNDAASNRD